MRRLFLVVAILMALSAAPAQAGFHNTWSGRAGINAASGTPWVREYAISLPATIYAATEGDASTCARSIGAAPRSTRVRPRPGGGAPAPGLAPAPAPDTVKPVLTSLGAGGKQRAPRAALKLEFGLAEGGSLGIEIARVRAGRKVGKT